MNCSVNTEFVFKKSPVIELTGSYRNLTAFIEQKFPPIMQSLLSGHRISIRKYFVIKHLWAPFFIMIGISILSGSAGIQTGGWSFTGMDKVGHLVVFGMLGVAWIRCLDEHVMVQSRRWAVAVVLTVLFGLGDELHQYQNPLRTFEWADLLADLVGAMLATFLYLRYEWIQKILEFKIGESLRLRSADKDTD